jgi:hypothetical protein
MYIADVNDISGKWKKFKLNVFHILLKDYWVAVYTLQIGFVTYSSI